MPVMAREAAGTPRFDNAMTWDLTVATVVNKGKVDVWTLTDIKASSSGNGKQRGREIPCQISAETLIQSGIDAKKLGSQVRLPMTRIAPVKLTGSNQLARGDDALMVDIKHEGRLSLNLSLRPLMQYQEVQ